MRHMLHIVQIIHFYEYLMSRLEFICVVHQSHLKSVVDKHHWVSFTSPKANIPTH